MINILNDGRPIKSITTSQDRFFMKLRENDSVIDIIPHKDEYGLWFLVWVNGKIEKRINSSFVTEIEY